MSRWNPLVPHLALIGVLILAALVMVFGLDVDMTGMAGVTTAALPEQVDEWRGEPILYCSSRPCGREFRGAECEGLEACTVCGEPIRTLSFAEWQMLPKDTTLNRKRYHSPSGQSVVAAVVLSGKNRNSLHRPQVCLTGNGRDIVGSQIIPVELGDGRVLKVMMLDMIYTTRLPNGQTAQAGGYYAYWFSGRERDTPLHLMRMFWMAWEKVVFSKIDRWAYISVAGVRERNGTAHVDQARAFIQAFHPLIEVADSLPPER